MIEITKSQTADTRTCDFANTSVETLKESSKVHIRDVQRAMEFLGEYLHNAATIHDADKLTEILWFHADFVTGFKQTGWWDNHRKINRHHLEQADGVPDDVNLLDILEYVADCVMAGMARSGSVRPCVLPDEALQRALKNTTDMLARQVKVIEGGAK